jgi:hypothetical protein
MNDVSVSPKPVTLGADAKNGGERKLPRRDWILLPILGLLTICVIAVFTELIARRMFPEPKSSMRNCLIENDSSTGVRGIPNSVCSEDSYESGPVEYRFNGCGHRAGMECGPKPPGVYRIVMVGTSTAFGTHLPREKTLAALLPAELSRRTGRNIELYNEALTWETPRAVALRFNAVLAANPDMILWIVTPWDIKNAPSLLSAPSASRPESFLANLRKQAKDSGTGILLEHFLYRSASSYVRLSLKGAGDPGFLGENLSPEWRQHLHDYDTYAANIAGQATAAGIPLVVVLVPERAQAAMISMGEWPAGYNPYELDNELRPIVTRHGGTYIDISPDFRSIPNPEKYYFPVDGHPNADGNRIISGLLANVLTGGAVPALQVAEQPKTAQEQGR